MFGKKKSTKDLVQSGRQGSYADEPEEYEGDALDEERAPRKKQKRQKKVRSSRSNFLKTRYFIGLVCILLAAAISFGAIPVLLSQTSDIVTVLVFDQNISYGQQISEDMLKQVDMSNYNLPFGVQTDRADVIGKYVNADVVSGDIVTLGRLSSSYPGDDPQLVNLPEDKLAVSITLSGMSQSLSTKLRAGDIIQIYAVMSSDVNAADSATLSAAPLELQYVEVLSVSDSSGIDVSTSTGNTIDTITLIVNAQQAAKLVSLEHTATLHAVLVTRGNEALKQTALELQEQLFLEMLEEEGAQEEIPTQQDIPTEDGGEG